MTRDEAARQWLNSSPDVEAMEDVPRRPTNASSHGGGWSAAGGFSFNGINTAMGSFRSLGQSLCAQTDVLLCKKLPCKCLALQQKHA